MASNSTKNLVGAVGFGKLLFSSFASAGKSQLGVTQLNLDMLPVSNIQVCYSNAAVVDPGQVMPNNVTVVIDPLATSAVQMNFTVGDLLPGTQDNVVFLAYSTNTTATPPLATPNSDNKLLLDLANMEILGSYQFPKTQEFVQAPTRVGQAQAKPRQKLIFTVDLSPDKINTLIKAGSNKIYLQAMIVGSDDFKRGVWDSALLSKLNSITFSSRCASTDGSYTTDASGGKTLQVAKNGTTSTTGTGKTK